MIRYRLDPGQIEVVDEAVARILRNKTPAQRLSMVFDANRAMRLAIEGRLRSAHPDRNDAWIRREVARRMLYGAD